MGWGKLLSSMEAKVLDKYGGFFFFFLEKIRRIKRIKVTNMT